LLRSAITLYGDGLGAPTTQVASALAFKAYSYAVLEPVVNSWITHRRVPDVTPSLTAIHPAPTGYGVAVTVERTTVLADDPIAGMPGTTVVASEDALLDALRRTLVESHLAVAVEAFRRIRRGGARPLWGSVAQSLCYPATIADPDLVPDPHGTVARLLSVLDPSVAGLVEVAELHDGARWRPALLRRTCCYGYALPSGELCSTCCLVKDEERARRGAEQGLRWRRPVSRPRACQGLTGDVGSCI
jgi:ferric iron reductase protein FhuF